MSIAIINTQRVQSDPNEKEYCLFKILKGAFEIQPKIFGLNWFRCVKIFSLQSLSYLLLSVVWIYYGSLVCQAATKSQAGQDKADSAILSESSSAISEMRKGQSNDFMANPVRSMGRHYFVEGVYYLIDENQPERAVLYLKKAIELEPAYGDAYYFLGVSYYRISKSVNPKGDTSLQRPTVRSYISAALFYLGEAEKRGIQYDRFRPNLLAEIQKQYPDVQPATSQIVGQPKEAQIIVEGKEERGGAISVRSSDGNVREFRLGEPIPLVGGEHYTIHFTSEHKRQLLKPLALVSSIVGVWLLR